MTRLLARCGIALQDLAAMAALLLFAGGGFAAWPLIEWIVS